MAAFRPDVTAVAGELWLAYNTATDGFRLQRFDAELQPLGAVVDLAVAPEMPTDIRVGLSGDLFWYAYETVSLPDPDCVHHFLSVAVYRSGPPQLDLDAEHIAVGCPTSITFLQQPMGLPEYPEAVDDPTPFVHHSVRYAFTRAWPLAAPLHHMRRLGDDLRAVEDTLVDTGSVVPGRQIAQNSLLHIGSEPFLVAGFASGPPMSPNTSELYIVPLDDDLRGFAGAAIRLYVPGATYPQRITRARYVEGTLIVNYVDMYQGQATRELIALFDVGADFAFLSQIQVQDHEVADNHSSFEIIDDRLYLFQQQDGQRLSAKVFRLRP